MWNLSPNLVDIASNMFETQTHTLNSKPILGYTQSSNAEKDTVCINRYSDR